MAVPQSPQALQEPQMPLVDFQPCLLWTFVNLFSKYALSTIASAVELAFLMLPFTEDNSEAIATLNIYLLADLAVLAEKSFTSAL